MTLVYRGENILRGFDDDVRAHLRTEMERRAIKVVTGQIVTAVEAEDGGYRARNCPAARRSPATASCSRSAGGRTSPISGWKPPA